MEKHVTSLEIVVSFVSDVDLLGSSVGLVSALGGTFLRSCWIEDLIDALERAH